MVITRFAPSPTGFLHVGGARTALYSYLFAKKNHGKFLLRIEDTDLERSTEASVQAIFEGMAWLGLASDEQPIFQTSRFDRYKYYIDVLLKEGKAYKCYCNKERLENLREQQTQNKEKPRYDGHCRHGAMSQSTDKPFVVRFRNPEAGDVVFNDLILGEIKFSNQELDDLIIARTDGSPTYNFTVVIDDMEMAITHVIRGNDHVNNTPRQINMFLALGYKAPQYAHVPMILGDDGKRLSKRHGAEGVMDYEREGYLPEALLNYLVRLGWSHGDQEIFSLTEMIECFDLTKVNKSAAAFNTEKLQWLNQYYIKTLPAEKVAAALQKQFEYLEVDTRPGPVLSAVIEVMKERSKTLKEMAEASRFWFEPVKEYDEAAVVKFLSADTATVFIKIHEQLSGLSAWNKEAIHAVIQSVVESLGLKFPQVAQPLRIALTGNTVSPGVDATLALFSKEEALDRIDQAKKRFAIPA
jgi:glutamyl-tRNA synthetase